MFHDVTKSNLLAKLTTYAFHDVEIGENRFLALPFEVQEIFTVVLALSNKQKSEQRQYFCFTYL